MFDLLGSPFTEADRALYVPYVWEERIGELLVEFGITETKLNELLHESSLIILTERLRAIPLHVPQGVLKWAGYDEKECLETNLYHILEELMRHDHRGSTWNGKVEIKELKAKLRHIKFPTE